MKIKIYVKRLTLEYSQQTHNSISFTN